MKNASQRDLNFSDLPDTPPVALFYIFNNLGAHQPQVTSTQPWKHYSQWLWSNDLHKEQGWWSCSSARMFLQALRVENNIGYTFFFFFCALKVGQKALRSQLELKTCLTFIRHQKWKAWYHVVDEVPWGRTCDWMLVANFLFSAHFWPHIPFQLCCL